MILFMHATVSNPECILRAGSVYDAPARVAKAVMAQKLACNASFNNGGRKIHVLAGEPAAVPYDERRHGKRPVLKIPSRPCPADGDMEHIEEPFEELV
jgi:hypothetical protein